MTKMQLLICIVIISIQCICIKIVVMRYPMGSWRKEEEALAGLSVIQISADYNRSTKTLAVVGL